jgi:tripartite-type tricarboxylate transporter receptor subunit TctC
MAGTLLRSRIILLIGAIFSAAIAAQSALAQSYPNRVIKIIVPFAAGGPADTLARIAANRLSAGLGQGVILDNRPGAGGTIGAKAAAAADPDGYTLLYGNTAALIIGPAINANVGYDPLKQFTPVGLVGVTYNVMVVNPAFPANSLTELIALAKARPGKINFASPGHGTPPHMVGEMLKQRAGIDIVHVPYRGSAAALTDIMAGQVELAFENPSVTVPLVQEGKLKALAVTGESRNPQLPNVPTIIESGVPDFVSMSFTGLMAPAGTPPEIILRLNQELTAGLRAAETIELLDKLGVNPRPGTPEDFAAFIARETEKWTAVAKRAGIRVE